MSEEVIELVNSAQRYYNLVDNVFIFFIIGVILLIAITFITKRILR